MLLPNHLVIMARAPTRGTAKRRLAKDIGDGPASRFYRSNLRRLLREVAGAPNWTTWLAVTPDSEANWCGGLAKYADIAAAQGRGDLGQRMHRWFDTLPPGPAAIIGADIPGIRQHHIYDAFRHLGDTDWVLGPAPDGGYWLIGARRRPAYTNPFQSIRWSTSHAMADTIGGIKRTAPTRSGIAFIEELSDVDTGTDFSMLNTIARQ